MELRTQLASQEDELTQLKRKWEKIVNRGFDRVYAANGIIPPQSTSGPVLGGIKEGVQEVSRIIAAGLGDYGSAPPNSTNFVPTPPRTHSTHRSTSSVTTSSSGSTRLSHSSASSSLVEDDPPLELRKEDEVLGKKDQVRILGEFSQSPTCTPILEDSTAVDISKTCLDEDKISKTLRRRSRDVPSETTGRVPSKLGQAQQPEGKPPMLPTSSMPGLGTLPSGTPSWVLGTVGKKWEELQRTETYVYSLKPKPCFIANPTQFQFHKKPETCIGVVGRHVSISFERVVGSHTIACHWGFDIHEPVHRLDIADTNREPDSREIGYANLTAG
jgi:hypothetical protein